MHTHNTTNDSQTSYVSDRVYDGVRAVSPSLQAALRANYARTHGWNGGLFCDDCHSVHDCVAAGGCLARSAQKDAEEVVRRAMEDVELRELRELYRRGAELL